jgi:hypothetical protein
MRIQPSGPDPRLEEVRSRLRQLIVAERRRHLTDVRFGRLLADLESDPADGETPEDADLTDVRLARLAPSL